MKHRITDPASTLLNFGPIAFVVLALVWHHQNPQAFSSVPGPSDIMNGLIGLAAIIWAATAVAYARASYAKAHEQLLEMQAQSHILKRHEALLETIAAKTQPSLPPGDFNVFRF